MLTGGLPPPAVIEFKSENGDIIQRYTPSGLAPDERAITAELVKAVKLCLICFHVHWPPKPPLSDAKPEVVGRLKAVVAKAEMLLGKKVDDPPLRLSVPPAMAERRTGRRRRD